MTLNSSTKHFWLGLVLMALSVFILVNATVASVAVVTVTGMLLILGGMLQIALGFWSDGTGNRLMTWGIGLMTLLLGWSFLSYPLAGIISLSSLLLVLLATSGAVQITCAFRAKGDPVFWPLMGAGVLSLILAIVVLTSPGATLELLGILLGLHMLSNGASLTMIGMAMQELPNDQDTFNTLLEME
ncbi:uncharacterized membrane protein HdeD (DUF308 family) [Aliiruegeria haliotis]|uniref:Uncharacterized membrane protein HdeD (DUF308 family) n=1 Tax=Aliiruegeria haliotis TaxID=1280846 RepID=A0A2T0RF28_9RHOB|nr:DUF308 domain-containing protein [Aliiruegeria haliotis]PRY19765.1 uncharacterized membrane protein HdeD (DUF308 family) [Aliiruegeria haliotis]